MMGYSNGLTRDVPYVNWRRDRHRPTDLTSKRQIAQPAGPRESAVEPHRQKKTSVQLESATAEMERTRSQTTKTNPSQLQRVSNAGRLSLRKQSQHAKQNSKSLRSIDQQITHQSSPLSPKTAMNAQVQKTLDTLESALQSLTDSIYTYNPSSAAARALVQAEEDLTRVLAHVAEHQSLHHRLLALSSLASEIDAQTVNILQKLESCHAELTALPPPPTPIAEPPTERVNPLLVEGGEGERKVPEYARPPVK
ncbi:hypothetical protein BJ508DRAFT_306816 [Ascobolus immersus RN42]|uniref:Mediator of RNA polymerase II transcription subunit 4 n=1 Tax=Ascobolus immersus RN42 TaxID=1160509 RepID=A0A3N4I4W2_ASCIM|nr:hypothetical protein BJ508DRAFT_306816 [Ascobolus immersus RN42]